MDLLILAAGFATRFETMGRAIPKHLLPISQDRVFLDLFFDSLGKAKGKFKKIGIVSNDVNFAKTKAWAKRTNSKIKVINNGVKSKAKKLGAVGDLLLGIEKLHLTDDVFICPNDHALSEFDFDGFIKLSQDKKASATVTRIEKDEDLLRAGSCLSLDSEGLVVRFSEKPKEVFSHNYGVPFYIIKKADIKKIQKMNPENRENIGEIVAYLVKNSKVYAVKYTGNTIHLTSEEDYIDFLKEQKSDFKTASKRRGLTT